VGSSTERDSLVTSVEMRVEPTQESMNVYKQLDQYNILIRIAESNEHAHNPVGWPPTRKER
jgi:hypothetical protein